ncbi:MAG: transposase [Ktedonobacterales bacterium]|nr:transposase [Ktedonobacterales bacterium]
MRLTVRRFFCDQGTCLRKTFAEPLPPLAVRCARRTTRIAEVLTHLGLALGGEAGARLAPRCSIYTRPDTLLRLVCRLSDILLMPPRVISIHDWAWCRGERYGTLICDVERHRRLAFLPQRDAASVAAWLQRYPSIAIISRDRGGEYAQAARLGAPQAQQVADRFHLVQNFRETIERVVRRLFPTIQRILEPAQPVVLGVDLRLKRDDAAKAATQQRRMARFERVNVQHEQGYNPAQIALYLGMTPQSVQHDLMRPPSPSVYKPQQGKLAPYKSYIHRRVFQEGCRNALQIFRELQEQGYRGRTTIVVNYGT